MADDIYQQTCLFQISALSISIEESTRNLAKIVHEGLLANARIGGAHPLFHELIHEGEELAVKITQYMALIEEWKAKCRIITGNTTTFDARMEWNNQLSQLEQQIKYDLPLSIQRYKGRLEDLEMENGMNTINIPQRRTRIIPPKKRRVTSRNTRSHRPLTTTTTRPNARLPCEEKAHQIADAIVAAETRVAALGLRLEEIRTRVPAFGNNLLATYSDAMNEIDHYKGVLDYWEAQCLRIFPTDGAGIQILHERMDELYHKITVNFHIFLNTFETRINNMDDAAEVIDPNTGEGMALMEKLNATLAFFRLHYTDIPEWLKRKWDPFYQRIMQYNYGLTLEQDLDDIWADIQSLPDYHAVAYSGTPPRYASSSSSLSSSSRGRSRPPSYPGSGG